MQANPAATEQPSWRGCYHQEGLDVGGFSTSERRHAFWPKVHSAPSFYTKSRPGPSCAGVSQTAKHTRGRETAAGLGCPVVSKSEGSRIQWAQVGSSGSSGSLALARWRAGLGRMHRQIHFPRASRIPGCSIHGGSRFLPVLASSPHRPSHHPTLSATRLPSRALPPRSSAAATMFVLHAVQSTAQEECDR